MGTDVRSPMQARWNAADARAEMLAGLVRVGASLCAYTVSRDEWVGGTCDCKFGGPKPSGEQTGCPEIRTAYWLIDALTEAEFTDARWRWLETAEDGERG